jgi:hypothetical protein
MTDWNALFRTNEFRSYRKKQVEAVAEIVDKGLCNSIVGGDGAKGFRKLDGQLEMARLMLKLPETLINDIELSSQLETQLSEDMAGLTKMLMRKRIEQ